MGLIERGAEAYARQHGFLGHDSYEEMDADDREQAREVARVILEAADCQGAVDALAKINDLAKYLSEPAWDKEGCRLVAEQIVQLAAPHLGGQ